jgi:hypothetical protein
MNASDYEAVGYRSEIYCIDCLPSGVDIQGEDVTPVFADSEWNYYPVCTMCGCEHDYVVLIKQDHLQSNYWEQQREFGGAG